MKKFRIVSVIFFFMVIFSCEKSDQEVLQNQLMQTFMKSNEFCKNELLIKSYGSLGIAKTITIKEMSQEMEYLLIPILRRGEIAAYMQVIDLKKPCLPNDERWAMNLIDLNQFENTSLTGRVRMFDLNFDGFKHLDMEVSANKIVTWESFDLPKDISLKYDLVSKGKIAEFFACYRETRAFYDSFDIIYFICDWASVSCAMSATAWCLYHAADYVE